MTHKEWIEEKQNKLRPQPNQAYYVEKDGIWYMAYWLDDQQRWQLAIPGVIATVSPDALDDLGVRVPTQEEFMEIQAKLHRLRRDNQAYSVHNKQMSADLDKQENERGIACLAS